MMKLDNIQDTVSVRLSVMSVLGILDISLRGRKRLSGYQSMLIIFPYTQLIR